jgi:RHS repeat-associated protein
VFLGDGNLTSVTDPLNHSISLTYDTAGRPLTVADAYSDTARFGYNGADLASITDPLGQTISRYTDANRRTTMQVAGQAQVSYTWDNANRLTAIAQGSAAVGINYDNANRRTSLTLPNGVTVGYSVDGDSRITGLTYSVGSSQLGNLTYAYDADGRVMSKGGTLAATSLPTSVSGNTYDADNGLTGFGSATLSYDANGNLISDGTNTYIWDARNYLTAISGATSASFAYDAFGRRASKTIAGTGTQFLYDGLNPVQELEGGAPTANLLTGLRTDEYFSRADSGNNVMTLLTDALGSTIGMVGSGENIATSYAYEPFGVTTTAGAASDNPYQFTGRENDGTGLYFYRARYYNPNFKRFIAQDPIDFVGGDANLYAYVWNNPIRWIDPVGLWGFGGTVAAGGDAGTGPLGLAGSGSAGGGVFWGGQQGVNVGGYASAGGFVGGPGLPGPSYPSGDCDHFASGAYGGIGGGVFFTNATSADQLKGPFTTLNIDLGPLSIQISWSGPTIISSATVGPGAIAGVSSYTTNTSAGTLGGSH